MRGTLTCYQGRRVYIHQWNCVKPVRRLPRALLGRIGNKAAFFTSFQSSLYGKNGSGHQQQRRWNWLKTEKRRNSFQTQDMHEHLTSSLRGVPDSSAGMLLMSRLNSIQSGMPGRRERGEGKVRKYNTESGPTGLYCQYNWVFLRNQLNLRLESSWTTWNEIRGPLRIHFCEGNKSFRPFYHLM